MHVEMQGVSDNDVLIVSIEESTLEYTLHQRQELRYYELVYLFQRNLTYFRNREVTKQRFNCAKIQLKILALSSSYANFT